nr:MAG: hypothetical protein [Bacteriophage sp.]
MMTNRELLINAARAGEIAGKYYIAYGERDVNEGIDIGGGRLWNPLINNADAFSLMVSLYATLEINGHDVLMSNPDTGVGHREVVNSDADREKATRLAIVNCAAIIGENL